MALVELSDGARVNCFVDDFLWPWTRGVPAFLVHGFARNGHFWDRWVPGVAGDRRVYRPEIRGCGDSPAPPDDFAFSARGLAADLVDVMDRMGLERVHWVGEHSGSLLGMLAGLEHPQRIASLVLCDAPTRVPAHIHGGVYTLGEKSTAAALMKYGVREWCAQTIDHRLDPRHADPHIAEWFIEQMGRTPARAAAGLTDCFGAVDIADRIEAISAPVLLLTGDASDWIIEQQRTLVERLPSARLQVFEGYGHGVNVLEPEACVRAAVAFWDEIEAKEYECNPAA